LLARFPDEGQSADPSGRLKAIKEVQELARAPRAALEQRKAKRAKLLAPIAGGIAS
jgi:hypothetical protein